MNNETENLIVDTAFEIKDNAWLGLGKPVAKGIKSSKEAFESIGLDFMVNKYPISVIIPDNDPVIIPEQYATVRTDTNDILGTVGEKYTISQYDEVFSFFDHEVEGGRFFYESGGCFGIGQRVFLNAQLRKPIVIGKDTNKENIILNIFLTNSHDAAGAISAYINPVRELTNTSLNGKINGKENYFTFRHTSGVSNNTNTSELMDSVEWYINNLPNYFNKMIATPATEEMYTKVIVTALADNPGMVVDYYSVDPSKRFVGNVEKILNFAYHNPTQLTPTTENTVFGILNSIAGYHQLEHEWKSDDEKTTHILDSGRRLNIRQSKLISECLKFIK